MHVYVYMHEIYHSFFFLRPSYHKVSTKIHKVSCVFFWVDGLSTSHLRLLRIPQASELPPQQLLTLHLLSAIALH